MNFLQFQRTPLFFIVIHVVVISYVVLLSSYIFLIGQTTRATSVLITQIQDTQVTRDVLSTQGNYTQSETFAIRYLKDSLSKKLLGEQVIDTSAWEKSNGISSYIPLKNDVTGVDEWVRCLTLQTQCLTGN